jgi:hypothetical protein
LKCSHCSGCRDGKIAKATVGLYDKWDLCDDCRSRKIAGFRPLWIEYMTEEEANRRLGRALFGEDWTTFTKGRGKGT